jgi:DNA-binding CsgD family transcriptional regulator
VLPATNELHVHQLGGAMARTAPGATAFSQRQPPYLINCIARPTAEGFEANRTWARGTRDSMARFGPGGLWRSTGATFDGYEPMAEHQRDCERQARRALGEQAFRAAYDRGLQLPAGDAVAYALQQPQQPPQKPPARLPGNSQALAMPGGGLLTPRELQVARLVAGGRSNKQIAAELVISQRTAEGHVERILAKLEFTSRAQVAAWVAASQPDGENRSI